MKVVLLNPLYFGPIDYFKSLIRADRVVWETRDHYQKQTFRTRQYIYGANGKLLLNIPISHSAIKEEKQLYDKICIENSEPWQRTHWRSLQSAYQSSPFFAYYEPEIKPLFQEKQQSLMKFNRTCISRILECLEVEIEETETQQYKKEYPPTEQFFDGRSLTVAKRHPTLPCAPYFQVFDEKHGFLPNLSILDLLFNLGPESLSYLKNK